jgi:hypothetical protein
MSFLNVLTDAQDGGVVHTLDERYGELLAAVLQHKAGGTMSLKVKVTPEKYNGRGEVIMVGLDFQCEVKKPALQPGEALFFVSDEGHLCRNPPGQEELFEERKLKTNG